eukprot:gene34910-46898_t
MAKATKPPWKRPAPSKGPRKASKHLSPKKKAAAKAAAKRAGRPYPNLVDNMRMAKSSKTKATKAGKKAVKKTAAKKGSAKKGGAKKKASRKRANKTAKKKAAKRGAAGTTEKDPKGGLTAAGLGAGKTIALMAPNMPEYCVVFHAVAWAGGTITTLNPSYTAPEVAHQLADSGADLLITTLDFVETAKAGAEGRPVVAIGSPAFDALVGEALAAQVPVDLNRHIVVLPYSSGTTGLPKGVMLSHRNLVVNVDQTIVASDFQPGEISAGFLPLFHIYGMTVLMNMHLAGGGALVTMPRFDLALFLKISQDYKAKRMWVVPPVAIALAKHPLVNDYDLSSLDVVFIAAAPSGAALTDAVSERLGCTTLQGYGMTELSPVSHVIPAHAPRSGSAGMVVSNTVCKIVDPASGEALPAGQEGELW